MPSQFDTIDVPYDGKVYTCRPTHRALFHAERALEINILTPHSPHLFKQPFSYIVAAVMWSLLKQKLPNITLDQCFDAFWEDQDLYADLPEQFATCLRGVLTWIPKEAANAETPLAGTASGVSDGPAPESSSASPTASSGD